MRYVCTGRVHPERADVSFSRIELGLAEDGRAIASCASSQVTIVLDSPTIDGWIAAHIVAEDLASLVVGALGFATGSGYSVEIIQVMHEDGSPQVVGVRPTGGADNTTLGLEPTGMYFNRAFRLSAADVFFRLAVADYLRAITEVRDCATYCYRAIEGIHSGVTLRTANATWQHMHEVLGTKRDAIIDNVKHFADPVRHGNWMNAPVTDKNQRWTMLSITRDVLTRYLEFTVPPSNER